LIFSIASFNINLISAIGTFLDKKLQNAKHEALARWQARQAGLAMMHRLSLQLTHREISIWI
jgi:hypothetical protein